MLSAGRITVSSWARARLPVDPARTRAQRFHLEPLQSACIRRYLVSEKAIWLGWPLQQVLYQPADGPLEKGL